MRFEHPEVKVVVMASGKDKVFCAGANIRMLGGAAHSHKVNFCKFTNETRNSYEDATDNSARPGCARCRARVRAAATNWRWRATRSS
jgi:benzoyl-CoA-dihydrodiol lyase